MRQSGRRGERRNVLSAKSGDRKEETTISDAGGESCRNEENIQLIELPKQREREDSKNEKESTSARVRGREQQRERERQRARMCESKRKRARVRL